MKEFVRIVAAVLLLTCIAARGQVPKALLHSLPAPPVGIQAGAQLGHSVAVDGGFTVVGAPLDSTGGRGSGVVKVFDSTTGALLHVLMNPVPIFESQFGCSVAISGTRIVVGAMNYDDPGATNSGRAYVYDLADSTPTHPIATLNNPDPMSSEGFGTSVAISGSRVVVGTPSHRLTAGGSQVGSAYVYDLSGATPTMPVVTLDNPTPAHIDYFGNSVAISGTTVVVSAPGDGNSVYVYDLGSATPSVPAVTLNKPSNPAGTGFGSAVAIDGTRVVVGAHLVNDDTTASGRAYVYDLGGATPVVPGVILINPSPHMDDKFGNAVAISGTRVVVGTQFDDTTAANAGRAYVYNIAGATPTVPMTTLNNPSPAPSDFFGKAVTISGTRVVVGAYGDDTGTLDAGSAYLYDVAGAAPTIPTVTLNNPGPAPEDYFGNSVAVSGKRVVVGVPFEDTGASNAGSVHIYDLASATPKAIAVTLRNPHPGVNDYFGNAVAIVGTRLAVSAFRDDAGAMNSGRVYIYDLASATPTVPIATLDNPNPAVDGQFGHAIAMSGATLVVSAEYDTVGAGKAHIYDLASATPTVPLTTLNNPNPGPKNWYGYSVAIDGLRVVVGAPRDGNESGSAFLYDLASATPTIPVTTLHNPDPAEVDGFGCGVGVSGTRVVVGTPSDDTSAPNAGIAYFYDYASPTPTVPTATVLNPLPVDGAAFGTSVAVSGVHVVVGVSEDDTGANGTGRAYIYDFTSATPHVPVAALNNPEAAPGDQFGLRVAIDGAIAVIGAPLDDSPQFNKGSAYVFGPADGDGDGLLDAWEMAHFGTTVGHSAQDDFDGDGHRELLELAFGRDPKVPDAAAVPMLVSEDGFLTITITKRAGATYTVQSAGYPEGAAFSAATTKVLLDDDTTLKVRDNTPIGTALSRFLRVQVTAAP